MLDWVDDRKKLLSHIGEFGELSPGTVTRYQSLIGARHRAGRLDARTRELIALAVAVTAQCDGCITVHVAEALKLDPEGLARDIQLLSIAVDVRANLFEQLQSVRDDDAALDRNLTIEGHLISEQIVEAQEVVIQLKFAANGANDTELMARARVILGPLGRKLDRLAGYMVGLTRFGGRVVL